MSRHSANCANVQCESDSNTSESSVGWKHFILLLTNSSIDSACTSASIATELVIVWKLNLSVCSQASIGSIQYLTVVHTVVLQLRGSVLYSIYEQAHTRFRYYIRSSVTCFLLLCSVSSEKGSTVYKKLCAKKFGEVLTHSWGLFYIQWKGFCRLENLLCGFIKHSTYSFNLVILQPPTPEKYFFIFLFYKRKKE